MISTVVALGVPPETRSGSAPKLSSTLSSSSSTVSSVAAKVISCDCSPAMKLTLAGTPE